MVFCNDEFKMTTAEHVDEQTEKKIECDAAQCQHCKKILCEATYGSEGWLEVAMKKHILYECDVGMIQIGRKYTHDGFLNPFILESRVYCKHS